MNSPGIGLANVSKILWASWGRRNGLPYFDVIFDSTCEESHIERMTLHDVDDILVAVKNIHELRGFLIPNENVSVIGARNDIFGRRSEEIDLLCCSDVAVTFINGGKRFLWFHVFANLLKFQLSFFQGLIGKSRLEQYAKRRIE